jgi:hypothetical protein
MATKLTAAAVVLAAGGALALAQPSQNGDPARQQHRSDAHAQVHSRISALHDSLGAIHGARGAAVLISRMSAQAHDSLMAQLGVAPELLALHADRHVKHDSLHTILDGAHGSDGGHMANDHHSATAVRWRHSIHASIMRHLHAPPGQVDPTGR